MAQEPKPLPKTVLFSAMNILHFQEGTNAKRKTPDLINTNKGQYFYFHSLVINQNLQKQETLKNCTFQIFFKKIDSKLLHVNELLSFAMEHTTRGTVLLIQVIANDL